MRVSVLVVDDEALIRAGFRALLDSDPELTVVGEAANGAQAVQLVRTLRPDVMLVDIRMPVMDGLEATRRITRSEPVPPTRVLVVTTFDRDEYVFEALRAGASGFVLKDTPPEHLIEAIKVVATGEALLTPTLTRRLITEFVRNTVPPQRPVPAALASLTQREREVLVQVAAGRSNAELAQRLHISRATAKTHVSNLLSKLDARDRVQLVVLAYESGIVNPGSGAGGVGPDLGHG
ncbi:response regulator transcription factor [Plantactinospora sp. S1510]|uniref:Response regulator transcription factor n=1 Tax=Plantactinospora alkalitolerans TaxID=2789879 RepID=A0ABS0GTP2_9ACTN|nr:response regulator transcription factor [Plantactinospora alkalitolerans]MBF9129558.1 response regulator transcription factor [Plantactinospora alkalitolerans]